MVSFEFAYNNPLFSDRILHLEVSPVIHEHSLQACLETLLMLSNRPIFYIWNKFASECIYIITGLSRSSHFET